KDRCRWRHIRPGLATVARHVHEAVVTPRPDQPPPRILGARRDHEHGAVVLDAGVVLRDRATRRTLLRLVVARQVAGNGLPTLAFVGGAEDDIGAGVEHAGIERREHDGKRPLEAVLQVARSPTHGVVGPGEDVALLAGADVEPREVAVAARVHDIGIIGARRDPAALAATHLVPVLFPNRATVGAARDAHGAVVLLRAADLVGRVRGGDDVIELRRRLVVLT